MTEAQQPIDPNDIVTPVVEPAQPTLQPIGEQPAADEDQQDPDATEPEGGEPDAAR